MIPKVSIIIAAYNAAEFVGEAIRSAVAQSETEIEILVIDDGSSDSTRDVIAVFESDSRLRYLHRENGGCAAAKNTGIREARADYVLFLDADDLLPPDSVARHLDLVIREGTLWATCDIIRRAGHEDQLLRGYLPRDGALEYALVQRFPFRAIFYHKRAFELAGMHTESIRSTTDWDLHARMIGRGVPFSYVPHPCYIYRIRGDSITKGEKFQRHLRNIERIYQVYYRPHLRSNDKIRRAYAEHLWRLGGHYRLNGAPLADAARVYLQSIIARPTILLEFIRRKFG